MNTLNEKIGHVPAPSNRTATAGGEENIWIASDPIEIRLEANGIRLDIFRLIYPLNSPRDTASGLLPESPIEPNRMKRTCGIAIPPDRRPSESPPK